MTDINSPIYCSIDPVVFSIINEKLHVLLFTRDKTPCKGILALPGGLIQKSLDKDVDSAVDRVLKLKTGVQINYREQVISVGGHRDPRDWTLSIAYMALVSPQKVNKQSQWVEVKELENLTLAFDHKMIIDSCVERLTNKVNYSTIPMHFAEHEFTFPDLQKVYEVILNEKLDKSSFRKKIEETGLLVDTGKMRKDGAYRPSKLYSIKDDSVKHFDKNMV